MVCKKCGTRIGNDQLYCPICGTVADLSIRKTTLEEALDESSISIVEAALNASRPQPIMPSVSTPAAAPIPTSEQSPGASASNHKPEPTQKKSKKKRIIAALLVLGLVIGAVAAGFRFFGKQTVYLVTKSVTQNANGGTTTYLYEYDDEGRIVGIQYEYTYPDDIILPSSDFSITYPDIGYEISYTYNSKGNLDTAEFTSFGRTIEIEYLYEDGKLVGVKPEGLAGQVGANTMEFSCDSEGRFQTISYLNSSGQEYATWNFEYYVSGKLKQSTYLYGSPYAAIGSWYKTVNVYDQSGNMIESATYRNDVETSRSVYAYNDRGQQTMVETYYEGKLQNRMEFHYVYENDRLADMSLRIEGPINDRIGEATIYFDCKWKGRQCTVNVEDVKGDEEALAEASFDFDKIEIIFEVDEAGNVLSSKVCYDGEVTTSNSYAYQAFEMPRDYKFYKFQSDPRYLYFLLGR